MSLKRCQIIYHNFPIPGKNTEELHPVLIISNDIVHQEQDIYIGIMISSSENYFKDYFSFELTDKMFVNEKLPKQNSHLRLHLITYFNSSTVSNAKVIAEIKEQYLNIILDKQREIIFDQES